MGWRDRDYNPGRENMNAYLSNPAGLLQFSVLIFRSGSFYVRLHFWFLIFAVFRGIDLFRAGAPAFYIPVDVFVMFIAVVVHEAGHTLFAKMVGGNHWEWVLWPLGGMIRPNAPPLPWNTFVANAGGLIFTIPLAVLSALALRYVPGISAMHFWMLDPFNPILVDAFGGHTLLEQTAVHALGYFCQINIGIALINLFPAFWFDGGYIWQSVLWPKFGQWRAMRMVCMAGMVLSVPCLLLALLRGDILGVFVWALVFSGCFNQRRALAEAGPGVMGDDDVSYNYMDTPEPRRKKNRKKWLHAARRKATQDQAEQAKIDAILAKVKIQGLHSLTWWEKRTLRRATDRQRQRDLANRL